MVRIWLNMVEPAGDMDGTGTSRSTLIMGRRDVLFVQVVRTLVQCLQMKTSHPGDDGDKPFRIYTAASLGAAIRHYRLQSGLSQAEMAERAGLNRTYLSDLEQGKETEQVKRILRVLKQLGVRMTLERADW